MKSVAGRRNAREVGWVTGAALATLVLIGCDPSGRELQVVNRCDETAWLAYSCVPPEERFDVTDLEPIAISVEPGKSAWVNPDLSGGGLLVARAEGGEWVALVPLEGEGSPTGDEYTIEGEACGRLLSATP